MWNGVLLLLILFSPSHAAAAETHPDATLTAARPEHLSCFDGDQRVPARAVTCEQIATASSLRPEPREQGGEATAVAAKGAGESALVGAGLGLSVGLMAGLALGPSCEEGHAGCTAGIIVGSTALFAIIGAIHGASRDDSSTKD
jgi:hypothetical protein